MKKYILIAYIIIWYPQNVLPQQSIIADYMRSNDLVGFMKYCNNNEEKAIDALFQFSLPDTIGIDYIWYVENDLDSIGCTDNRDCHIYSLKLKTYYWIMSIYDEVYKNKNIVYVHENNNKNPLYDYVLIEPEIVDKSFQEVPCDVVITSNEVAQAKQSHFCRFESSLIKKIENSYLEWYDKMQKYGLKCLRQKKMRPVELELLNISGPFELYYPYGFDSKHGAN